MEITQIKPDISQRKIKVAAYCRVSTTMDAQEGSIALQKKHYESYIKSNKNWHFAGIFSDEKSGTSSLNRTGFQKMLKEAKKGKIDLILCKSISRFARNIVDSENAIKLLKGYNTCVYFEKENLRTDDPSCNIMLSLLSAIAQDESRSISENVKWANRERVKRGEYTYGNNRVLGYDWINGELIPNSDAKIIREIFSLYVKGESFSAILKQLNKKKYTGLRNKPFEQSSLIYILSNPIYVGDMILQKKPPTNCITNYAYSNFNYESNYLTDDHKPIISRETWDKAQAKLKEREVTLAKGIRARTDISFLSGKILCGYCGQIYVRRNTSVTLPEGKKSVPAWTCKSKRTKKKRGKCKSHILKEEYILNQIRSNYSLDLNDKSDQDIFLNQYSNILITGRTVTLTARPVNTTYKVN